MKKLLLCCTLILVSLFTQAQEYSTSSIFAHNDYVQPIPLFAAYQQKVGYIEADVFLEKNGLLVAHTRAEIDKEKTLEALYLKPLQKIISDNKGFAYADTAMRLVLMIDIKTEGIPTLDLLVKRLKKYPGLTGCPTFKIAISGNMPAPSQWNRYPDFIHFDGRPGIDYTKEQLNRVGMISTSFKDYTQWNGKGVLTKADKEKITAIINEVHKKGKKIRFWAAPDFNNAWTQFMYLGVDILNTDNVASLTTFIKGLRENTYQNKIPHEVYSPENNHLKRNSRPKNIILLIGDGMGLTQLYSAYTANYGNLNIFNISDIGFSVTTASDSYITDSAAGGTAMASGKKTNNRHVGVDSLGNAVAPLTEKLKLKGFKTAVISNGDVTDATPAAFYAHQPERSFSEAIALDFLTGNLDILIGGGSKAFKNRKDGRNIFNELEKEGYVISESIHSMDSIQSDRFLIIDDKAATSIKDGRGDFLSQTIGKSAELLSKDASPFFIMAEGAQIDWGGHNNDMEYVVREVLDFDKAVGEAMDFVDKNGETLLIVTADHETGGLSLIGGDISKGYVHGNFSTTDHTAVMVPVFSYGPGSELFRGVYQNTALHWKILQVLKSEDKR